MKKIAIPILTLVLLSLIAFLAVGSARAQEDRQEWGRKMVTKLLPFIPKPVAGLRDNIPWEPDKVSEPQKSIHERGLWTAVVWQVWWIIDDAEVQKVKELEGRRLELLNRLGQLFSKKVKDVDPKIQQVADEAERVEKELGAAGEARELRLRIEVVKSSDLYPSRDMEKVGTVKGYPLYSKKHKGRDTSLSVVVGRERFQIKVEVVVLPTPTKPLKEAHVALARQMLEKVDYAGLAKLIQT